MTTHHDDEDQAWADLLAPTRRRFLLNAGLAATGLATSALADQAHAAARTSARRFHHAIKGKARGAMTPPMNQPHAP